LSVLLSFICHFKDVDKASIAEPAEAAQEPMSDQVTPAEDATQAMLAAEVTEAPVVSVANQDLTLEELGQLATKINDEANSERKNFSVVLENDASKAVNVMLVKEESEAQGPETPKANVVLDDECPKTIMPDQVSMLKLFFTSLLTSKPNKLEHFPLFNPFHSSLKICEQDSQP
jgi:hypothetical protein